jgi:ribosomal protein L16 Arg81 hydroxylase
MSGNGLETLPFPVLDAFLGASASEFFENEWQRGVRVFPNDVAAHRLAAANFDFRAVVAAALKAGRLEVLGDKGRTGPRPGEPGWPDIKDAASARVTRAQDLADDLAALCRRLSDEVSHRVSVNLYVTPPRSQGLDRHQDGHDVLILQLEGRKRWRIWPSDAPPPLDSLPALTFETGKRIRSDYRGTPFGGRSVTDQEIAGKTEWNLDLGPGEMIYVPRGWAHEVWTEDSHSAHLTFGFHLTSWVDLLMIVVAQGSRRHGAIRESLPIGFARRGPDADEVRPKTRALLALLGDIDGAEAMEEVIGRWLYRDTDRIAPDPAMGETPIVDERLRLRRRGPAAFVSRGESVGLFRPSDRSSELWFPKAFAEALQFVATVEPPEFEVKELPGVSASGRNHLCAMLMATGYLQPVSKDPVEARS